MFDRLTHIIHKAAYAQSPLEQVQAIVDEICAAIQLDVCSLYRQDADGNMELLASHGLDTTLPIRIPAGQGLVGRVIREGRSINLINPANEKDYFYLPQSKEEAFLSFFGAPMIHHGKPLGVLVVQGKTPQRLSSEREGFLVALTAHLSVLVAALPARIQEHAIAETHYQGVSGSSGLAMGRAVLLSNDYLEKQSETKSDDPERERQRWAQLQKRLADEFGQEHDSIEATLGANMAAIMDVYAMFLHDPALGNSIHDLLNEGFALNWAITESIYELAAPFEDMDDPYLKARSEDIYHLGNRMLACLLEETPISSVDQELTNIVLVGDNISVSDIVSLPTENILAIVSYQGAALSHSAVLANALGIPSVLGVGRLPIYQGDLLIVDGVNAEVILRPSRSLKSEYKRLIKDQREIQSRLKQFASAPTISADGQPVCLMANSGLQADLKPGLANGAEGIGLYRTEIPFMIRSGLPSEDEQVEVYEQVVAAYHPKPVYIRTLDVGSDKPLPYLPVVQELNPALGLRGIRFTLDNYQLQLTQMRAILRAAKGRDSVHMTLPMVSTTEDLDRAKALLNEAYLQLKNEGLDVVMPKLGVMVEVPAAISLLPFWASKIDYISIGSNDLSQYLLAVDRTSSLVAEYYNVLNPAVIHEIQRIVKLANKSGLKISLCGEMAANPIAVMLLLGMGIRHLSMSSAKIPLMKWIIAQCPIEKMENFVNEALCLDNASAIKQLGSQLLSELGIDIEKYH